MMMVRWGANDGSCSRSSSTAASCPTTLCLLSICAERKRDCKQFNDKRIEWNNISFSVGRGSRVASCRVASRRAGFIASMLVFIKARSLRSLTAPRPQISPSTTLPAKGGWVQFIEAFSLFSGAGTTSKWLQIIIGFNDLSVPSHVYTKEYLFTCCAERGAFLMKARAKEKLVFVVVVTRILVFQKDRSLRFARSPPSSAICGPWGRRWRGACGAW